MINQEWQARKRSGGFTLIEVLLVVAILGVLATVAVLNLNLPARQKQAMVNATRAKIDNISTAVNMYAVDTGKYPSSLQSLVSSSGEPNWLGPYVKGGVPVDAWGTQFQYSLKGDTDFIIRSAGPDRNHGSGDDITSFSNSE